MKNKKIKLTNSYLGGGQFNNAFTLIELLAIIVILAIIAVITIPIILNITDNAGKGAAINSAYGYTDAVNKAFVEQLMEDSSVKLPTGVYILKNTNTLNGSEGDVLKVNVSGNVPDIESWLELDNGKVISYSLKIGDYIVSLDKTTKKVSAVKGDKVLDNPILAELNRAIEKGKQLADDMKTRSSITTGIYEEDGNWIALLDGEVIGYSVKVVENGSNYVITLIDGSPIGEKNGTIADKEEGTNLILQSLETKYSDSISTYISSVESETSGDDDLSVNVSEISTSFSVSGLTIDSENSWIYLEKGTDYSATDYSLKLTHDGYDFYVNKESENVSYEKTGLEKKAVIAWFKRASWDSIISAYNSGDEQQLAKLQEAMENGTTKEVYMGETLGTHYIRIANLSNSVENGCKTEVDGVEQHTSGFSETACGLVLEFADNITTHRMNPFSNNGETNGDGNKGGWQHSEMRTYLNGSEDGTITGIIYEALPENLRNKIIPTTVVSGHGGNDSSNFTTTDKLYLLSTAEVWEQGSSNTINNDTARDKTRQLDYYKKKGVTTSNYSGAIKRNYPSWLRSARSSNNEGFFHVNSDGAWNGGNSINYNGVSPAFRISN